MTVSIVKDEWIKGEDVLRVSVLPAELMDETQNYKPKYDSFVANQLTCDTNGNTFGTSLSVHGADYACNHYGSGVLIWADEGIKQELLDVAVYTSYDCGAYEVEWSFFIDDEPVLNLDEENSLPLQIDLSEISDLFKVRLEQKLKLYSSLDESIKAKALMLCAFLSSESSQRIKSLCSWSQS